MGDIADDIVDSLFGSYLDFYPQERDASEYVQLIVKVKAEADKAWLCMLDDLTDHWFPKSICYLINGNIISMPFWLAQEKGIEGMIYDTEEIPL